MHGADVNFRSATGIAPNGVSEVHAQGCQLLHTNLQKHLILTKKRVEDMCSSLFSDFCCFMETSTCIKSTEGKHTEAIETLYLHCLLVSVFYGSFTYTSF